MSRAGRSPCANRDDIVKFFNATDSVRNLVRACFNNDFEHIFHFVDSIHLYEQRANEVFDQGTIEILIRKTGLCTIKEVIGKYKKESTGDDDMHFLHEAVGRGDFAVFEYLLSAKQLHKDISCMKGSSGRLINSCLSDSLRNSEHVVNEKIQILRRLINLNPKLFSRENLEIQILRSCGHMHIKLLQEIIKLAKNWILEDSGNGSFLHKASSFLSRSQLHELITWLVEIASCDSTFKSSLQKVTMHHSKK